VGGDVGPGGRVDEERVDEADPLGGVRFEHRAQPGAPRGDGGGFGLVDLGDGHPVLEDREQFRRSGVVEIDQIRRDLSRRPAVRVEVH
jgi:hypothetical protein